jgi:hypothetical protein
VEWPHLFSTNFLNIISVISLDVQGMFVLDCYVEDASFYYTFGFSLCLPLLLVACISISFVCQGGAICTGDGPDPGSEAYRRRSKLVAQHLYALFFGLYLIWPGVTSDMLRLFHCQSIYGEAYLVADLSIKCFEDTWIVAAVFGLVGIVAYTIGIPFIFYRLIATQESLDSEETQARLGFLYTQYKYEQGFWYYEVVIMGYKALLSGASIFLSEVPGTQVLIVFAISIAFALFSFRVNAFADDKEGNLQAGTHPDGRYCR